MSPARWPTDCPPGTDLETCLAEFKSKFKSKTGYLFWVAPKTTGHALLRANAIGRVLNSDAWDPILCPIWGCRYNWEDRDTITEAKKNKYL